MRANAWWPLVVLVACAEPSTLEGEAGEAGEPAPEMHEKVRGGELTTERPEVGSLSVGCTGTLVSPEVVITAAHCMGYRSAPQSGRYATFEIEAADGSSHRFVVSQYVSYGNSVGSRDISLLRLAEPVPESVAKPAPIAATDPVRGSPLAVYGYGCTERGYGTDWLKRRARFAHGEDTNRLCPGDSGGPVFDETTGSVLRINSGYWFDRFGTDIFGHVPTLHETLRAQIVAWTASGVLPEPGDLLPGGDEPGGDQPAPPQPRTPKCGAEYDIYSVWTCTADRSQRHRCLQGGEPEWEVCGSGCSSKPIGVDDLCAENDPNARPCGPELAPYVQWTCASDGRTLLRCNGGFLETFGCNSRCVNVRGRPDRCR